MSKVLTDMSEEAVKSFWGYSVQDTSLTVAHSNAPPSINPGYVSVILCFVRFAYPLEKGGSISYCIATEQ